jgi:hypothetical protein
MMNNRVILPVLALVLSVSGAAAQAPPSATTPLPPTALAEADCVATPPTTPRSNIAPESGTVGQASEPLGDKLAKSNGVLCPPSGVDPQMRAPTPDAGNTPVIPPPGSPGGNPNLQPK